MSAGLLQQYEHNFCQNGNQIDNIIEHFSHMSSDKKRGAVNELKNLQSELSNNLKQMQVELLSLNQNDKQYKNQNDELKKKCRQCEEQYHDEKNRESLLGSNSDVNSSLLEKNEKNSRLLSHGQKLSNANQRLVDAKNNAIEMEGDAIEIQLNLHKNSETMRRSIAKTKELNNEYGTANSLLSQMNNRRMQRKIVLYCVMFMVALTTILIIYFKYK